MKAASHIDYEALYEQGLQHISRQHKVIALLKQDVSKSIEQQQRLGHLASSLQKVLIQKEQHIAQQHTIITAHQQTILGQLEKLQQQQSIILEQNELIGLQKKELEQNKKDLSSLALVKHELKVLKKMIHGRRSEKHYPAEAVSEQHAKAGQQLALNMEVDSVALSSTGDTTLIAAHIRLTKQVKEKKPHPGRHGWPEGLREELILLDPADKPEGSSFLRFEDTRQLACRDMEFYIKVYRRSIYMAPANEPETSKQLIALLPAHPIAKCKADISVLVKLVIDKFIYHLPAWRQQQRFKQYGIELQYNTLCHWINRIGDVLEPLYSLLLRELIISRYLMMDETTYRVLDSEKGKGKKSHIGYLWACSNPIQRIVAFSYQKGRGKKEVAHILKGYKGYLQTDGYAGYTKYGKQPGVIHLQCMAHARRLFCEARSNDLKRSDYALEPFSLPYILSSKTAEPYSSTMTRLVKSVSRKPLRCWMVFTGGCSSSCPQ